LLGVLNGVWSTLNEENQSNDHYHINVDYGIWSNEKDQSKDHYANEWHIMELKKNHVTFLILWSTHVMFLIL